MKYPKKVMKKTELEEMGFPEEYLIRIFHTKGQTIAWKMSPAKSNSTILFDVEAFEKLRVRECGIG